MSLPRGAVGWPAVCDFGISWSHSLIRPELKLSDSSVVLSCDTNYFRKTALSRVIRSLKRLKTYNIQGGSNNEVMIRKVSRNFYLYNNESRLRRPQTCWCKKGIDWLKRWTIKVFPDWSNHTINKTEIQLLQFLKQHLNAFVDLVYRRGLKIWHCNLIFFHWNFALMKVVQLRGQNVVKMSVANISHSTLLINLGSICNSMVAIFILGSGMYTCRD